MMKGRGSYILLGKDIVEMQVVKIMKRQEEKDRKEQTY